MSENRILNPSEIEFFVQSLKPSDILLIGSEKWFDDNQRFERLRSQCAYEATNNVAEYVKDVIITYEKLPVLVYEVILIHLWRKKVWRKLFKQEKPVNEFLAYSILYHECTGVNFLQLLLYHKDAVQNLKEECLDLIDYCASQLVYLTSEENHKENAGQEKEMLLNTGGGSISIIASFGEYLDELSLSAIVRLYETHDFPVLFANLLRNQPWKDKTTRKVYNEGLWVSWDSEELCKIEAQCWIGLRGLLLHPAAKQHYELTAFRRETLTNIQKFLTEIVVDQLAPLIELKQFLGQLSVFNEPKPNRTPIILETVAPIREALIKERRKWKELTLKMMSMDQDELINIAKKISETFEDSLDKLNAGVCDGCGQLAQKRCSKCRRVFYCSRKCQVGKWGEHKLVCDLQN